MKSIGVYVHIPFCIQKCYYCDFVSFADKKDWQERYINALIKEMKNFFDKNPDTEIKTVYIGGGTPSCIEPKYIEKIMSILNNAIKVTMNKQNTIEATIEVNPGTISKEKLVIYKKAGINRLSIGLQSSKDELLRQIGRIHNFQDFLTTYNLAKEVGFDNINVDLMIGLPRQTIADIKKSLEKIINLEPQHISVYSLIIEEETKIAKMLNEGKIILPDEELERQMYWYVKNFLELNGYTHYEISNYAKKGYASKHNLDCWSQNEYVGFGLASHSYIENTRFSNTESIEKYITNCESGEFENNKIIQEQQNFYEKEKEYMLIGLRKIEGLSIQSFKNKFGENPIFVFRNELNKLVENRLLQVNTDRIKLTNKGLDLANIVWEEFV